MQVSWLHPVSSAPGCPSKKGSPKEELRIQLLTTPSDCAGEILFLVSFLAVVPLVITHYLVSVALSSPQPEAPIHFQCLGS